MASSRMEKVGTIYSRVTGLLKSGSMKPEDKPLWYDIYKAFPPKYEPKYSRPAPDIPIKQILYPEDVIRARFQKDCKDLLSTVNLISTTETSTQKFMSVYNKLKEDQKLDEDELFTEAVNVFRLERSKRQEKRVSSVDTVPQKTEKINVAAAFKAAIKEMEESKQ